MANGNLFSDQNRGGRPRSDRPARRAAITAKSRRNRPEPAQLHLLLPSSLTPT